MIVFQHAFFCHTAIYFARWHFAYCQSFCHMAYFLHQPLTADLPPTARKKREWEMGERRSKRRSSPPFINSNAQEALTMGIFGKIFGKAEATVNRVAGRSDLLEAMCAGAALAAAADGNIDDSEVGTALEVVANNETLSKAFSQVDIDAAMNKQIKRANGGFSGKAALWKEIADVARNPEDAEAVFLIVLDVVHSDGSIDAKEQAVLDKLAKTLNVDQSRYAA